MNVYPYSTGDTVIPFPRRRGRPRKVISSRADTGTPELVMKRLRHETAEALDLCLQRGIITPQQHWCGIHLRWLYTLRYGAPGIRAIDPTHLGGMELKKDDPEWRSARELEYHEATRMLLRGGYLYPLMDLCIYNERPTFLSLNQTVTEKRARAVAQLVEHIQTGLELLARHWER